MKHQFVLLLAIVFIFPNFVFTQTASKKPLDHSVYDDWKDLKGSKISDDGKYVSFEINPQDGDGMLHIRQLTGQSDKTICRGYGAQFSPESNYIVFKIKAPKDSTRKAQLAKKKKDDLPKDSLGVWTFNADSVQKFAKLKSFELPEDGSSWFAYVLEKKKDDKKDTTKLKAEKSESKETAKAKEPKKGKKKSKKKKSDLKPGDLFIANPLSGKRYEFTSVTDYFISKNGALVSFTTATGDTVDSTGVYVFDTKTEQVQTIYQDLGISKKVAIDDEGTQAAFVTTQDTAKAKVYSLYYWKKKSDQASLIVDTLTANMPAKWSVSEYGDLSFSQNGKRLYFGTAKKPVPAPKDTLTDDEKVHVDIWNWKDSKLQPQQLKELDKEKKRTYLAVYHIKHKKMLQLADETVPAVRTMQKGDGDLALGIATKPYEKYISWEYPPYRDAYTVDVRTGAKQKILTKKQHNIYLSPFGKYVLWYEAQDKAWYSFSNSRRKTVCLTKQIPVNFYNEIHDNPYKPYPYGIAGWTKDDKFVLIYDRYDIWKIDPRGEKPPFNLTQSYGRENDIQFRYLRLDREKQYIDSKDGLLLRAFHLKTKQAGFFKTTINPTASPKKLVMQDVRFSSPTKAKHANTLIWTKESLSEYPNLWVSDLDMGRAKKLSDANPQQQDYNWATVELVHWLNFNGKELDGLLYKPENFNPNIKYPMIVYFYSRTSDYKNRYYVPKPSASIIYPSYYASNGYIVFIPDIVYGTGHPGDDAYNCVVSGTMHLLNQYNFINKDKMALQGQSWGGYQVAYLVTRTDLYAAAMAGAPVSNMTSAYGGIRWGSGLSRMFQYEQTQSRIGGSLWERPELYIENSPVFHAPKITTPLLIMHNDNDGAVPWYQGIELFVALRRLDKPAWLLCYNGDEHNLKRRANKKDLSIRMQQFFDHFLKDAPAPVWLEEGVPAIDKGKEFGYKLIDN